TAFALFTKNQRQWESKPLNDTDVTDFKESCQQYFFNPRYILPHDSYLINLGNPNQDILTRSRNAFMDELRRCDQLGLSMLNFHPGSHLNLVSEKECLNIIADSLNMALDQTPRVTAVIENTAGMGSAVGYKLEHLANIIEKVNDKERIGVCLDTCHLFVAGYDIRTRKAYQQTMSEFDRIIGFKYLRGMHLNDSKRELASRVDRHENIGRGLIGPQAFSFIVNDPRLDDVPLILETPNPEGYAEEISFLNHMIITPETN
ncbi:deoxyribonuclease IV, partial [candidate division KSB1 bacterium]|nr:deoxyribonuclease IV [candidate division KSB1 bacterium]